MGWFSKKTPRCDWCGVGIDGRGVEDGSMMMCSVECVEQKNAPKVEPPPQPSRGQTRAPTLAIAQSELMIAAGESTFYESLIARAMGTVNHEELLDLTHRAHDTYVQFWEHLDLVRTFLVSRGAAPLEYDKVRSVSLWRSDTVNSRRGLTMDGHVRTTYTATFHPQNVDKARYAVQVMQHAIANVN